MLKYIAYHLGRRFGRLPPLARALVAVGFPLAFAWWIWPSESPQPEIPKAMPQQTEDVRKTALETQRSDHAVQKASSGAIVLKKAMRDPESFKLESAFVIDGTGAVCYEYRAKNGFGGTNVGHAVFSADGKQFKTSETEGFTKLWNRECANKSGTEAATAIRWFVLRD